MNKTPVVTIMVACRIAGIDRDRFNEAVAAGRYPCAPKTVRGSSRMFTHDDLILLVIYGWLIKGGLPPRLAGAAVLGVSRQMALADAGTPEKVSLSVMGGVGSWTFNIATARHQIDDRMRQEAI